MNFKEIPIGPLIEKEVAECDIELSRICSFMKCTEQEIRRMYKATSIETENLLKWSKLLEYDFFRLYSQHLILYAPAIAGKNTEYKQNKKTGLPQFRKNIYTKEIIDFILRQIESGEMSKTEVIEHYKIPKTTLYKWIWKYKGEENK
ncbi:MULTISPECIES: transposase [Chryseobacterium]|uniref:Transposase n=1 Tax=Chryseobacterium cucumeris TaxID=1813611 RepID=A0ABX9XDN5_9FLAO|nr:MULTISPECIES: transposase [Chryseobacterium]MDH5032832.1 transposase [Chryseobacterium cucumeris]QWT86476.1 transposase [Chryseobacterium sp. PCH239]ROH96437.1 transposase [Chryseobacterium cucumeris]WNI37971.1 transposase [Chryseobacterium sp. SG20098]